MRKRKMIGMAVVMIAIVAFAVTAVAAAQEPNPPDVPELEQGDQPFPGRGFGMRGGFHGFGRGFRGGEARQEALADALGIPVEELEEAQQQARETMIEQAVENGLLTQEQADLMLSLADLKNYINREELVTEALGVSPDDLQEARKNGTLSDLIEELGGAEAVREKLAAAHEQALEDAVADGVISEELAEQLSEGPRFGFGMGGHRGFHNFGGRGGGNGFGQGGFRGFGLFQNEVNQPASTGSI